MSLSDYGINATAGDIVILFSSTQDPTMATNIKTAMILDGFPVHEIPLNTAVGAAILMGYGKKKLASETTLVSVNTQVKVPST